MPCLVVVGSGPGIGTHVARKFASSGFDRIALLARSPLQLDEDKDSVTAAAEDAKVHVGTYAIDITNSVQLLDVLDQVARELGPPDAVFFNAARVKSSTLLEADDEEILYDFKVALPFTWHESGHLIYSFILFPFFIFFPCLRRSGFFFFPSTVFVIKTKSVRETDTDVKTTAEREEQRYPQWPCTTLPNGQCPF